MSTAGNRWWFVGVSGSGKTTYARAVAAALDVPHHELDATYHLAHWRSMPRDEFRRRVLTMVSGDAWTIDGNYRDARDLVLGRATIVVALDLPRATVTRQVVARSVTRARRHEELWNGNVERTRDLLRWDPERSIIRWSWTNYHPTRERLDWIGRVARDAGATFVRVPSHAAARSELSRLTGGRVDSFLG